MLKPPTRWPNVTAVCVPLMRPWKCLLACKGWVHGLFLCRGWYLVLLSPFLDIEVSWYSIQLGAFSIHLAFYIPTRHFRADRNVMKRSRNSGLIILLS